MAQDESVTNFYWDELQATYGPLGSGLPAAALPLTGGTLTGPVAGFQDQGSQEWNMKAGGAKADGVTNDATKVSPVLTAASNTIPVFWPAGNYHINQAGAITRPVGQTWRGAGQTQTTIQALTGSGNAGVATVPGSATADGGSISDLQVTCENAAQTPMSFANLIGFTLERVAVVGGTVQGLLLSAMNEFAARSCPFQGGTGATAIVTVGGNSALVSFDNCSFSAGAVACIGLSASGGTNVMVFNTDFEGSSHGTIGLQVDTTNCYHVIANYFELWTTACIKSTATSINGLVIESNHLQINSGTFIDLSAATSISGARIANNTYTTFTSPNVGVALPTAITDIEVIGNRAQTGTTGTYITIGGSAYPYSDLIIRKDTPTDWIVAGSTPTSNVSFTYGISPKAGDRAWMQGALGTSGDRLAICTTGGASPVWTATAL